MYCVYGDAREPTCIAVESIEQKARIAMCLTLDGYIVLASDETKAIQTYQFIRRVVSASRHMGDL